MNILSLKYHWEKHCTASTRRRWIPAGCVLVCINWQTDRQADRQTCSDTFFSPMASQTNLYKKDKHTRPKSYISTCKNSFNLLLNCLIEKNSF